MIVLVTGVPGVGKSSVCSHLASDHSEYRHIHFGSLIARAISGGMTERELRQSPSELVTGKVLSAATNALVEQLNSRGSREVVLVDSHAVSQDWYGYLVTPDGPDYFRQVRYECVVQLQAPPSVVLGRSAREESGRRALSERDLVTHEGLQSAVSVTYAASSTCPLFVVDASGNLKETASRVDRLLTSTFRDG